MINFLFGNNLNTLLSTNIDENATILTVSTGMGTNFPSPNKEKKEYFAITLAKYDNDDNTEICFVIAKDGDKFTVLRGQEGTIPQKWDQGTKVSNRITAEPLNQIKDKANQSDVDEALGNINFKPYYRKDGDTLTGAMHTNGNYLWGDGDKTYLIGQDNAWFIKNSDHVALITFKNGNITLNGQYSSFTGSNGQFNTITNNGSGKVTFDTETYFPQPFVAQNSFSLNYNDLKLISNAKEVDSGSYRNTNSILWQFGNDTSMRGSIYFQEHVGTSNNLIFYASGGENYYNYVFDNFGKISCKSIFAETAISSNAITVNQATVQNGNVTVQSDNTTADGNGFIHGNAIEFQLTKRSVNGSVYLQENPGVDTELIFQVSGGGNASSMIFNNQGNITAKNFLGTALEAKYADLAEYYISDQKYDPGTIVKIGGINEITTASKGGFFMGVISTNPALRMNTDIKDHPLSLLVALAGRVPVKVIGAISKGDAITLSEIDGIAIKAKPSENIIGFALEDKEKEDIQLVECSVKSVGVC